MYGKPAGRERRFCSGRLVGSRSGKHSSMQQWAESHLS
ncbi:unnamed protein product [Protopolystoma xenopodis]|uniref:Uncharacterized protein n=1 Tax=Protopolystoma xenopodis TaxID=117903 RepID=A0A448XNT0_9PLAT|nr:unnamed protein product [Protopolystoma xenopodis]